MFTAGVRAHLTASRLAVPLMLRHHRGLIVSTTANLEPLGYLRNMFYDLSKNAVRRLAWAMAQELREHGIASLAVAPGFMRTERIVEAFRRAGALAALDSPAGPGKRPFTSGVQSSRWHPTRKSWRNQVSSSRLAHWRANTGSPTPTDRSRNHSACRRRVRL